MENIDRLCQHGLFDARVPRYTSYPPANHFGPDTGAKYQHDWLAAVPRDAPISVYVHIPFCRRLCWFCACRTQGTKTLRPVAAYIDRLVAEIAQLRARLPDGLRMGRLHLGGGTPTLLSPQMMTRLTKALTTAFPPTPAWEFSVEIDPTEVSDALLETLRHLGMNRASVGVQDFAPKVQSAIGRPQSLAQTRAVTEKLRALGVPGLNLDLLYGLPHQTSDSFAASLAQAVDLGPDRIALYGYAHVPWMSKRQVMIDGATLPDARARFALSEAARASLLDRGYLPIGLDHFALAGDGLARAAATGRLRRNFQGYTDDTAATLIGFGASAISRFAQGYVQNAVATHAWQERIDAGQLAGHRGYRLDPRDKLLARAIEDLMCQFRLSPAALTKEFPSEAQAIKAIAARLQSRYANVLTQESGDLVLVPGAEPLVRVVAASLDAFLGTETAHSAAI